VRADAARRRLCALVLLAAGAACVPGNTQKVPPVHGVLLCGSTPVADAAVTWTTESAKGDFVAGATTDGAGRFELEPVKKWEWAFILLPLHATAHWRVDVRERGGTSRVLWRGKHYGLGPSTVPAPFVLECDLERHEPCVLRDAPDDQRYLGPSGRLPVE
jgi:hypothetical protein